MRQLYFYAGIITIYRATARDRAITEPPYDRLFSSPPIPSCRSKYHNIIMQQSTSSFQFFIICSHANNLFTTRSRCRCSEPPLHRFYLGNETLIVRQQRQGRLCDDSSWKISIHYAAPYFRAPKFVIKQSKSELNQQYALERAALLTKTVFHLHLIWYFASILRGSLEIVTRISQNLTRLRRRLRAHYWF